MAAVWAIFFLQVLRLVADRSQVDFQLPVIPARKGHVSHSLAPELEEPSSLEEKSRVVSNCTDGELIRTIMNKFRIKGLYDGKHHCSGSTYGTKVFCHRDDHCSVKAINLLTVGLKGELPAELAGLKRLETLILGGNPQLHGRLSILSNLTKLQEISIMSSKAVTGDLADFGRMKNLRVLNLRELNVTGDLQVLSNLTKLKEIFLDKTQVTGDLAALKGCSKMERLYLGKTKVTGSAEILRFFPFLTHLSMPKAPINGTIDAVRSMSLQNVDLSYTRLTGHISSVVKAVTLRVIKLAGTQVSGDIVDLEAGAPGLVTLDLSRCTHVTGDIKTLLEFKKLKEVDLAHTQVTGRISTRWRGKLKNLQTLNLAGSRVQWLPRGRKEKDVPLGLWDVYPKYSIETEGIDLGKAEKRLGLDFLDKGTRSSASRSLAFTNKLFLPDLVRLDVSGCPLNGNIEDLLRPLAGCGYLARISASGTNLSGHIQDLAVMENVLVNSFIKPKYSAPLTASLQYLDLSRNRIASVAGWTSAGYVSFSGNPQLRLSKGLLTRALKQGINVDLTGVSLTVEGQAEARELLAKGLINMTDRIAVVHEDGGYACYDLKDSVLRVTPADFLPDALCLCLPGWHGSDVRCNPCAPGEYTAQHNRSSCSPCPNGSMTSGQGAASLESCLCEVGRIFRTSSGPQCGCEVHTALHQNKCADCNELNLDCPSPGFAAESAPPRKGSARLDLNAPRAYRCLDSPYERCNISANGSELGCAFGYEGPLCTACAPRYRSSGTRCKQCDDTAQFARPAVAGLLVFAAVAGAILACWMRSGSARDVTSRPKVPKARDALWPLLLAQGSVLLQFGQLWGVLVALGGLPQTDDQASSSLWEQEYIQWLQFTAGGVRDALSLECAYGRMARTLCALAAPCVPLMLLKLCAVVEVFAYGKGVSLALQVLSLLFIGGASSCAKLLQCQQVDGGGEPLHDHAFRALLPHTRCSETGGEAGLADAIGLGCAVSYAIVIPALLLYLIMKQHLILAPSKRFVSFSASKDGKATLGVGGLEPPADASSDDQEALRSRHLISSAVAFCAVFFRGPVRLERQEGALTIQRVSAARDGSGNQMVEFDADSLMSVVLENKADADLQRWQGITRMLTERCVLEQVEASDRIMAGAKELFYKYAAFREVWVEVALKLIAVALVAVASSFQSLMMTLGFTLGTAMVLGTLKPYRQRQVNDLQCFCFFCLSAAAAGFAWHHNVLARGALAAPFAVAAVQALRPDGPEALALRLFEAASVQWPALQKGEAVELTVETVSFF